MIKISSKTALKSLIFFLNRKKTLRSIPRKLQKNFCATFRAIVFCMIVYTKKGTERFDMKL